MAELAQVLRHVLPSEDPDVLVDAFSGDDAAVYRLDDERALVVSVDVFTPVVDDAFDFGRIGAANALSDLYAMGARPLLALNIVAFPRKLLDTGTLEEIVRGGSEICREAGVPVLGGHSIDDPEPKFGMVVVGEAHPDRVVTNARARPGDRLVLTKPLGSGVVSTAIKAGAADDAVIAAAVRSMATLNRGAADAMRAAGATAATDVTGFGLLGHLRAMLRASGASARLDADAVPALPGVGPLIDAGHVPGGTKRNLDDVDPDVTWDEDVDDRTRTLLADAQTSGGLLIAIPPDALDELLSGLGEAPARAVIGTVEEGRAGSIRVGGPTRETPQGQPD